MFNIYVFRWLLFIEFIFLRLFTNFENFIFEIWNLAKKVARTWLLIHDWDRWKLKQMLLKGGNIHSLTAPFYSSSKSECTRFAYWFVTDIAIVWATPHRQVSLIKKNPNVVVKFVGLRKKWECMRRRWRVLRKKLKKWKVKKRMNMISENRLPGWKVLYITNIHVI